MNGTTKLVAGSFLTAALALAACGGGPKAPPREAVLEALQKEAATMKADGEKPNPTLGVESTWVIEAVDVQEDAKNAAQPWRGVVKFKIVSKMREPDGKVIEDVLLKSFDYGYDVAAARWQMRYVAPKK